MSNTYSIQVNSETFETDVLQESQQTPVLVDFYADWCEPCKSLGPILEKLAEEYGGAFILAKIDADAEQALVSGMGVRSLPTVVLFKNGQPADHFMGALSEGEIRAMLDKHVEQIAESPTERAKSLVLAGQYDEAVALYQLITADDPENHDACLDMAQALFQKGDPESADAIVERLPDAYKLDPRAKAIIAGRAFIELLQGAPDRASCESRLVSDSGDSEARYYLAAHLMMLDLVESAIEELLVIVRTDRTFREDGARQLLIQIFNRLGNEDPQARNGRKKLATLLMV
ncbi:thioredoxin [Litorivicinus sp.]|jgi:putative thioredoxin|nr:thioredoxin [Litorivicinus sp.]